MECEALEYFIQQISLHLSNLSSFQTFLLLFWHNVWFYVFLWAVLMFLWAQPGGSVCSTEYLITRKKPLKYSIWMGSVGNTFKSVLNTFICSKVKWQKCHSQRLSAEVYWLQWKLPRPFQHGGFVEYCYKITIMFCHFAIYSPISKYSCCLIKWDFVCLGVAIVARGSHIAVNTALCKYQAEAEANVTGLCESSLAVPGKLSWPSNPTNGCQEFH